MFGTGHILALFNDPKRAGTTLALIDPAGRPPLMPMRARAGCRHRCCCCWPHEATVKPPALWRGPAVGCLRLPNPTLPAVRAVLAVPGGMAELDCGLTSFDGPTLAVHEVGQQHAVVWLAELPSESRLVRSSGLTGRGLTS